MAESTAAADLLRGGRKNNVRVEQPGWRNPPVLQIYSGKKGGRELENGVVAANWGKSISTILSINIFQ